MSCACQGRFGLIAAAVGVAAATVGAVNFARTGCPLGMCQSSEDSGVVATSNATLPGDVPSCCQGKSACDEVIADDATVAAEAKKKEEERLKAEAQTLAAQPVGG